MTTDLLKRLNFDRLLSTGSRLEEEELSQISSMSKGMWLRG